jgi:hypothetical protein
MKLCASPETLAAYRAARPTAEQTMAAELAEARQATQAAIARAQAERARAAAAEAETDRLRALIIALGSVAPARHVLAGCDMGMTPTEAQVYGILREATRPMRGVDIARGMASPDHKVSIDTVQRIVASLRVKLADAGSPWAINVMSGQGYRIFEVAP